MNDITFEDQGSIVLIRPMNLVGREWLEANLQLEGWQWFGGAVACEPRFAPDVAAGMLNDGLMIG